MKWTTGCGIGAGAFLVLIAGCIGIGAMQRASEEQKVRRTLMAHIAAPMPLSPSISGLAWRTIAPGVNWAETKRLDRQEANRVWLYRPTAGGKNIPCVVIAPAGSRLFHGMLLGDGDIDEHVPYIQAGFTVVAYELAGPVDENAGDAQAVTAAKKFMEVDGGVKDAQIALDIAENLPWVNRKRIFLAGHSSAATLALEAAAFNSKRIAGCAAYAPEVNVSHHLGTALNLLEFSGAKGIKATLEAVSPHKNTDRLTSPLFLFAATDDTTISANDVQAFANTVHKTNKDVTFRSAATGGHYDAMIQDGIPAGIRWMQTK